MADEKPERQMRRPRRDSPSGRPPKENVQEDVFFDPPGGELGRPAMRPSISISILAHIISGQWHKQQKPPAHVLHAAAMEIWVEVSAMRKAASGWRRRRGSFEIEAAREDRFRIRSTRSGRSRGTLARSAM